MSVAEKRGVALAGLADGFSAREVVQSKVLKPGLDDLLRTLAGARPRRSARPCSVMMTDTSCSVWSTWLTIGTIAEMAPPLAVDGETKQLNAALRVKSPEPPMPFCIFEPMTWVEFTLP